MGDSEPLVNGNGAHDSPFVKELQKTMRNVNKKLSLMIKVDSIIAENPDMTLDQLVSARKINADQKAQALKKPSLQSQLVQLEEQITQYRKFEAEFTQRHSADKAELTAAHQKELEELRSQIKPAEPEKPSEPAVPLKESLLSLSRFLRAAAARRMLEDDDSEETKAFEGALLLLYGGDETAVEAMEKLIEGAEEGVTSTEGALLSVTYSTIKKMSLEAAGISDDQPTNESVQEVQPGVQAEAAAEEPAQATTEDGSDPTITNAGMTEQADVQAELPNGHATEDPQHNIETGNIDAGAANESAATQWDVQATSASTSDPMSESWVSVPRDPAETENSPSAAAVNATQSWADEAPPAPAPKEKTTAGATEDGFHEVQRKNVRGGRGGHEGNGRGGGGGRGRGFRGGRGRGGGEGRGRGGRGRGGGDAAAA